MTKTTVIDFTKPSDFSPDPLTDSILENLIEAALYEVFG
jgi:hypothetical protein